MTAILSLGLKCTFLFPWKNWNKWKDISLWGLICCTSRIMERKEYQLWSQDTQSENSLSPPLTSTTSSLLLCPLRCNLPFSLPLAIQPGTELWDLSLRSKNMDTDHITTIILEFALWVAKKSISKFEISNTNDNPEDFLGKRETEGLPQYILKLHILLFYEVDPAKGKLLGNF